jgi:hypothetical protein
MSKVDAMIANLQATVQPKEQSQNYIKDQQLSLKLESIEENLNEKLLKHGRSIEQLEENLKSIVEADHD